MEKLRINYDEKFYKIENDCITANVFVDDTLKKEKILIKEGKFYIFRPTYIDYKNNYVLFLKKFMGFEIKIEEKSIEYFFDNICRYINDTYILEIIISIVKRHFNKDIIIIDINKKFKLNEDTIQINDKFIKDLLDINIQSRNMENAFYRIKYTNESKSLVKSKYLSSPDITRALYHSDLLGNFINSTILSYSDDTILKKISEFDIESINNVIYKMSSLLDLKKIKNIEEKRILEEAINTGEKILNIKNEKLSNKKIKEIYDKYLKQKEFDKYFKKSTNAQLEKLWEAYITKYSFLIFDIDKSNISNQFQINRKNRKYIPDFVITDMYGTKTIVEIKTHNVEVVKYDSIHDCLYFSSKANKAIGQTQGYLKKSVLSENVDKEYFSSAKGMIIIGNRLSDQMSNSELLNVPPNEEKLDYYYKCLRDLNSVILNIEIVYFDDLINSMKRRLNRLF